jgi:hypothetical protein
MAGQPLPGLLRGYWAFIMPARDLHFTLKVVNDFTIDTQEDAETQISAKNADMGNILIQISASNLYSSVSLYPLRISVMNQRIWP